MKIYDCFLYFNEIDILYIRLKILYNYVDYFIIIDSTITHQGEKRENMYYEKFKNKYKEFEDKILYIKCEIPDAKILTKYKNTGDSWKRIHYHRDYIKTILHELNCNDDDIILSSDVDEIMYPEKLINVLKNIKLNEIYFFHMMHIKYYLNIKNMNDFIGTFVLSYHNLKTIDSLSVDIRHKYCHNRSCKNLLSVIKKNNKENIYKIVENGGLHLSTLGGPDSEGYKCKAYSHCE